jgi:hypothetical protein
MSQKHWIDEFFRKRLEQEKFAVEKGELEDMHALLTKRNGTGALIRAGRFSKWWLSALIPVAGLLWWAWADQTEGAEVTMERVEQQARTTYEDNTSSQVFSATNTLNGSADLSVDGAMHADAESAEFEMIADTNGDAAQQTTASKNIVGEGRTSPRIADATRTPTMKGRATVDKGVVIAAGNKDASQVRGVQGEVRPRSERDGAIKPDGSEPRQGVERGMPSLPISAGARNEAQDRRVLGSSVDAGSSMRSTDAHAMVDAASMRSSPNADRPAMADMDLNVDGPAAAQLIRSGEAEQGLDAADIEAGDLSGTDPSLDPVILGEPQPSVPTSAQARDPESTFGELVTALVQRESIDLMAPRWSTSAELEAPRPVYHEVPEFKFLATGELHGFGAPLAVRARKDGQRSEVQNGLLLGVEYRVRTKRFSWATGIYYGSYAIKADEGSADVSLAFVEVPVLASLKVGRGRFGLLAQGGISVDLLFNSNGRYPVTADRTSAGFPEEAFSAANISWLLRPQALYHVDERLSVGVGPLWKAQLSPVANDGALDGARILSSGVSFGLTWRLERTTY